MATEGLLVVFLILLLLVAPVSAIDKRFQNRSLYIEDIEPGATTSYTVSWDYMSPEPVGSVDMLFCIDPIPYHPCVTPPGLDVSGAVLSEQSGETGFSILSQTDNHIVLTRAAASPTDHSSVYKFDNIINPTYESESFAIRLKSLQTTDGSGPQVDFGSVKSQVQSGIVLETQVPPMLIFCMAEEVEYNCSGTNENYFTDLGVLESQSTLSATSQMAVGTNASAGFVITANGAPLSAGTNVIDSMAVPAVSRPGTNQFGLNVVENTAPAVGADPLGEWANAVAAPDYSIPDHYKFVSGDTIAHSPNVSLMKVFTVSYIINADESLRPGVYSTTVTFIASGRF